MTVLLFRGNESTGQMIDPLLFAVLFIGTTISVIANDKQERIVVITIVPKNIITLKTTRCGIAEPKKFTNEMRMIWKICNLID